MIFNESVNNASISYEGIKESAYDLGIGGALMHVYENECNYNALMKAAALSEMKYYNETGKDLFVQEAGALGSFWEKVKAFFKKVIEKIKAIFKKFVSVFDQFTMDNKKFVKKYYNDLTRKNLADFEFNGYAFPGLDKNYMDAGKDYKGTISGITDSSSQDEMDNKMEQNRGALIGEGGLTESEFRTELHDWLYGDKDTIENIKIRDVLSLLENSKKDKSDVEKAQKKIVGDIGKAVDAMEKDIKAFQNENRATGTKDDEKEMNESLIKTLDAQIKIYKAYSNDLTVFFGAVSKAVVDRAKQCKAICVKALSYKHEAATVAEGAYSNIFAGVEII